MKQFLSGLLLGIIPAMATGILTDFGWLYGVAFSCAVLLIALAGAGIMAGITAYRNRQPSVKEMLRADWFRMGHEVKDFEYALRRGIADGYYTRIRGRRCYALCTNGRCYVAGEPGTGAFVASEAGKIFVFCGKALKTGDDATSIYAQAALSAPIDPLE